MVMPAMAMRPFVELQLLWQCDPLYNYFGWALTLSDSNRQTGVGDAVFVQLQSTERCGLLPSYSCNGNVAFVILFYTGGNCN